MFDVAWKKTASETVAEHRRRKELEQQNSSREGRRRSIQSVTSSSTSSKAQNSPRAALFGFFGSPKKSKATEITSKVEDWTPVPSRLSCHEVSNSLEHDPASDTSSVQASQPKEVRDKESFLDNVQYSPTSNAESTFSRWPGRSDVTESSMSSITDYGFKSHDNRPLSGSSFAIVNTLDTTYPQPSIADLSSDISDVNSAEDRLEEDSSKTIQDLSSVFPKVPRQLPIPIENGNAPHARSPTSQVEPSLEIEAQKSWRPPESWGQVVHDQEVYISPNSNSQIRGRRGPRTKHVEAAHLQRHIRKMRAASPKIILERIREQWTDLADATIYRELEFEKQLWMLTGLKVLKSRIDKSGGTKEHDTVPLVGVDGSCIATKALSLYENQACASFLATETDAVDVYHLKSTSLAARIDNPLVQPLTSVGPYITIPYPPSLFASIHALTLPALFPSSSLPALLGECHKILIPGGILHLTLMDPSPVASSAGPRLRRWLDNNLVINLQTHFRCITPSRLIPIWLRDAGFACDSSPPSNDPAYATKLRFWAVGRGEGGFAEVGGSDDAAKEMSQLTAVVGRMLWREIWGNFVVGDKWWWEDEQVVEECVALGTRWDCLMLKAVKVK